VILIDTGPFVALFDPKDASHQRCRSLLRTLREPLTTTVPVLTEAFHLLDPGSLGAKRLGEFVLSGGTSIWFMDQEALGRAVHLMERYSDHPMDLADASLIAAAESLQTRKVFTLDRNDFSTYRIQQGHRHETVEIVG
jgi:predicted nucleic acid-binding protein